MSLFSINKFRNSKPTIPNLNQKMSADLFAAVRNFVSQSLSEQYSKDDVSAAVSGTAIAIQTDPDLKPLKDYTFGAFAAEVKNYLQENFEAKE